MINIKIREIANFPGAQVFTENEDAYVKAFSVDSRTIRPGEIFIALSGKNFDGHNFIDDAVRKGASGLMVEDINYQMYIERVEHVIIVKDTLSAMGMIAARVRKRLRIPFVCVTGTNGKMTLKDILAHVLSSKHKVLKSKGSYNNIIGLSLSLFDLDPTHDIAVLELGTNYPGEIEMLSRLAQPQIAIITNIGSGHLKHLSDRKGVFDEKISLLDALPGSGMAILNKDDTFLSEVESEKAQLNFFGEDPSSEYHITKIKKVDRGFSFCLNGEKFSVPLEGRHNVFNAAAAIACAKHFGLTDADIRKKLEEVSLPSMRLERVSVRGVMFINDAYNANPDSFASALSALGDAGATGKKGVVAGDMLELGAASCDLHRALGKNIAGSGIDFFVMLGDKSGSMAEGALEGGMKKENIFCVEDHQAAADVIKERADDDTVVLLKGSRGTKMEEVIKCFTTSYTP